METLTSEETRAVLAQSRLGHLGLAREGRAYVVPIFFAYDGHAIYFESLPGLKDRYLAGTREACLAVTRVASGDRWESVLVFGQVEEVKLTDDLLPAMYALLSVPLPPAPGPSGLGGPRRGEQGARIHRLRPTRISGRKRSLPLPAAGPGVP